MSYGNGGGDLSLLTVDMGTKTKHQAGDVIKAIKDSNGIKAEIARRLGIARVTVDAYLNRWVSVRAAYDEECESITDMARSNIINDINIGDVPTSKWWLVHKDPDFKDKKEIEVTTKTPIQFIRENRPGD